VTVHWPVQVPILVRERDCGPQDEVDEAALLVFFREARRAYLGVVNADDTAFGSRVLDLRLRVHRVATVDDDLAIRIRCDAVGRDAFRFCYLVRDRLTGETVAEASSTQGLVGSMGLGVPVSRVFHERLMALEGCALSDLDATDSEVDDRGVIAQRSTG